MNPIGRNQPGDKVLIGAAINKTIDDSIEGLLRLCAESDQHFFDPLSVGPGVAHPFLDRHCIPHAADH